MANAPATARPFPVDVQPSDDFYEVMRKIKPVLDVENDFQAGMTGLLFFDENIEGYEPHEDFIKFEHMANEVIHSTLPVFTSGVTALAGWRPDERKPHVTSYCDIDPVWRQPVPEDAEDRLRLFKAKLAQLCQIIYDTGLGPFHMSFDRLQITNDGTIVLKTARSGGASLEHCLLRRTSRDASHGFRYGDGPEAWSVLGKLDAPNMQDPFPYKEVNAALQKKWVPSIGDKQFKAEMRDGGEPTGNYISSKPFGELEVKVLYYVDFSKRTIQQGDIVQLARVTLPEKPGSLPTVRLVFPEQETLKLVLLK